MEGRRLSSWWFAEGDASMKYMNILRRGGMKFFHFCLFLCVLAEDVFAVFACRDCKEERRVDGACPREKDGGVEIGS